MGGMRVTKRQPIEDAPEGGFYVFDDPATDQTGGYNMNRRGHYANESGQTWDSRYGWVGAPSSQYAQGSTAALRRTVSGGGGGGSTAQPQEDTRPNIDDIMRRLPMPNAPLPSYNEAGFDEGGQAQAFARAKDQIAQVSRGSLEALRDEMAGRGIASTPGAASGIQEAGEASVINRGQAALGDVTRQQGIERANFNTGRNQRVAQHAYDAQMAQYQAEVQRYMSLLAAMASGRVRT